MIDPKVLLAFSDELEKIAAYKRVKWGKRLFGKIKRVHKKAMGKRVHKKWKYKSPSSGSR